MFYFGDESIRIAAIGFDALEHLQHRLVSRHRVMGRTAR
jgi:hypothetical protein